MMTMMMVQTRPGRVVLAAGREVTRLADVCTALGAVPASVLASLLCELCSVGLLHLEVRPSHVPTVKTTPLGLEILRAFEEQAGAAPGDPSS